MQSGLKTKQVMKIQPLKQNNAIPASMEEELSTTMTFIGNLYSEVKKGDVDLEDTSRELWGLICQKYL